MTIRVARPVLVRAKRSGVENQKLLDSACGLARRKIKALKFVALKAGDGFRSMVVNLDKRRVEK